MKTEAITSRVFSCPRVCIHSVSPQKVLPRIQGGL